MRLAPSCMKSFRRGLLPENLQLVGAFGVAFHFFLGKEGLVLGIFISVEQSLRMAINFIVSQSESMNSR